MQGKEVTMPMYELLCEYAKRFGKDFPISKVMQNSNESGVIQMLQHCLSTNTPMDTGGGKKNAAGKK